MCPLLFCALVAVVSASGGHSLSPASDDFERMIPEKKETTDIVN